MISSPNRTERHNKCTDIKYTFKERIGEVGGGGGGKRGEEDGGKERDVINFARPLDPDSGSSKARQ